MGLGTIDLILGWYVLSFNGRIMGQFSSESALLFMFHLSHCILCTPIFTINVEFASLYSIVL